MTELTTKELYDQLVDMEKRASIDLEGCDRRTAPSMAIMVNQAKDAVADLQKQYFERVAAATVGIFVLGPAADQFAGIAEVEGGTVTVRADALYTRIADMVTPILGDSREFNIISFAKVNQALAEIGVELGIKSMDQPKYKGDKVPTYAALVAHIRNTIRDELGDDLNRLYVASLIQKKAYSSHFKSSVLPVVVVGLEGAAEVQGLESAMAKFGAKVTTAADTVMNKESVLEVFRVARERLQIKKTVKPEAKKTEALPETTPETKQ